MTRGLLRSIVLVGLMASLSSCQALDSLVGGTPEPAPDTSEMTTENPEPGTTEETEETVEVTPEKRAVPTCDTLYSAGLVIAFGEEGRIPEGDISQDGYGYGTTNQDLVSVIETVREDLRISCTWYLPPEFSSTTTIAILPTTSTADVEATLGEVALSQAALGSGNLWKLEGTSSNDSGEYNANEAHFIAQTPCPSSLAETECSVWIASTNSAGSAEELTRDAASVFGSLD